MNQPLQERARGVCKRHSRLENLFLLNLEHNGWKTSLENPNDWKFFLELFPKGWEEKFKSLDSVFDKEPRWEDVLIIV